MSHQAFGQWLEGLGSSVFAADRDVALATAGFDLSAPTPLSNMPTTGTASYRGGVVAGEFVAGELTATLDGDLVASADFARGRIDAAAELANAATGAAWGQVSFDTLAISGGGFAGSAVSSKGHSGLAEGTFFGPAASEIGGLFELDGPSVIKGAFAAGNDRVR